MEGPSLAVVIPVHNKERHVARSLLSVQSQTSSADEIIIIDDASSDKSMQTIRSLANERVIYHRRDEPGPGGYAARNLGIQHAKSEWIAFLDADDYWMPDHLQAIRDTIGRAASTVACVFSGYQFVEPSGQHIEDWFTRGRHDAVTYPTRAMLDIWLEGGCPMWTGAVAIRRQTLIEAGLFPAGLCRRGGDRDLWLRTILHTDCAYTGRVTARYHRDADNMLTNVETFTVRQRLLDSIAALLPSVDGPTALRLRRIANREMRQYAFKAWKGGLAISPPMWSDFDRTLDRVGYWLIRAMAAVPFPFSQRTRGRFRHIKSRMMNVSAAKSRTAARG